MRSPNHTVFLLAAALVVFASSPVAARVLPVPLVCQEQTAWCWAACTQATIHYYEQVSTLQCFIADYACSRHGWCSTPCGCCSNPGHTTCCNRSNCMYGALGCIDDLLLNWGISSVGSQYSLSLATIRSEINTNCRPFIINWYWTGGGGHYIVGHGVDDSNNIYYMDPLPVGDCAYHVATYNWMVAGANHTWEWSLRMTTSHYCLGPDNVICEAQGAPSHPPTYWYDVTPVVAGRCDFHVRVDDSNASNYSGWSLPAASWQFAVHQVGQEWWASWWDPNCANAIFGTFRFRFTHNGPPIWAPWRTTISGTSMPSFNIVDWSENHATQTNGYGYLVHAPSPPSAVQEPEIAPTQTRLLPSPLSLGDHPTAVRFELRQGGSVRVELYDITGRPLRTLVDAALTAGQHEVTWDGRDTGGREIASGIYLLRLTAPGIEDTGRLIRLR